MKKWISKWNTISSYEIWSKYFICKFSLNHVGMYMNLLELAPCNVEISWRCCFFLPILVWLFWKISTFSSSFYLQHSQIVFERTVHENVRVRTFGFVYIIVNYYHIRDKSRLKLSWIHLIFSSILAFLWWWDRIQLTPKIFTHISLACDTTTMHAVTYCVCFIPSFSSSIVHIHPLDIASVLVYKDLPKKDLLWK